jgi:hypothetical protein
MFNYLKIAFRVIWAVRMIVSCVTFGAVYGWQKHGWTGALALGFVGPVAGTFIGYSPELLLQLLQ